MMMMMIQSINTTGYSLLINAVLLDDDTNATDEINFEFADINNFTEDDVIIFHNLFGLNVSTEEEVSEFDKVNLPIAAAELVDYSDEYCGKAIPIETDVLEMIMSR